MPFFDAEGNEIDVTGAPEEQELVTKAVKEATSGLATNKEEILSEKKALQKQLDDMSKTWDGLDPEAVRNIMTRLEGDEETKLLAEGKMDEVLSRRTERLQADHRAQIEARDSQIAELTQAAEGAQGKVKQLRVEGSVRQAAAELGVVPSAIPDALQRAFGVFNLNEEGGLVAEKDGSTWYGKNGKTPISPSEWLETMKEEAPHWFPAPSGGGAGGGNKPGGQFTISRADARDVQKYRAAREAAEKAGTSLQIVG